MACAQYQQLQQEFPKTTRLLEKHFLPALALAVTDAKGHNPAGYVLYQLRRAQKHAETAHGELAGSLAVCDVIFAAEVQWQADKKTVFRNLIPALGTCIYNVVHERGERFKLACSPPARAAVEPTLRVLNSPVSIGEALNDVAARKKVRAG